VRSHEPTRSDPRSPRRSGISPPTYARSGARRRPNALERLAQRDTIQLLEGIAESEDAEPELRKTARVVQSALKRKAIAKKMLNRVSHDDRNPTPSVCVRAMGKSAEYKPAKYQIRLSCLPWPKKWTKTKDLAGSMCHYGLDVRWDAVPKPVRDWVLGKRAKPPSERELIALLPKRASDESMKAEITFFDPKTKRFSASLKGGKGAFPVMFAGAKKKVGQLWANRTAVR